MLESRSLAVAKNLLRALRFFGQARNTGEVRDIPGVSLIFCGLNYAAFNAALVAEPIDSDPRALDRVIDISSKQFDSRNVRWTCWVCDAFLGLPLRRDASRIFSRHGLRPLTDAPGMYAERLAPPRRGLPALEIEPVNSDRTRSAFAHIMSVAFDIPYSVCLAIYAAERAWMGELKGYVGFVNQRPVTTAAAIVTGDVIGLYSVATMPEHRRLGYAEAIMRKVVEQAGQSAGIERSVLQATQSGLSLYKRMGYESVTNFNVYIAD
jgi:ribosomal protein S18 acetylase RimI-like enzyme